MMFVHFLKSFPPFLKIFFEVFIRFLSKRERNLLFRRQVFALIVREQLYFLKCAFPHTGSQPTLSVADTDNE